MQGSLSIERMCYLAQVSRAGFYRSLAEQMPVEEGLEGSVGDSTDRRRTPAALRLPKGRSRTAAPRNASEPQTSGPDHARG